MKKRDGEQENAIDIFSFFTFACFKCTFTEIVNALEDVCCKPNGNYKLEYRKFAFDLYEVQPLPGGVHLAKSYFFKPKVKADICVMFSNCSDGWYTLVNVLSIKLQCDVCLFSITAPDVLDGAFNGFRYIRGGNPIRTVYAMQDPRWVFYEEGQKQWFENTAINYQMRMIKKRMNKEILISYCERLGFDIINPMFWQCEQSVLLEELPRNTKK